MSKAIVIAALAALALTGCNKAENKAEAEAAAQEAAQTENLVGQGAVEDCTDDAQWRPGVKVNQLTVLDFNATWCGPCKMLKPAFDQAAARFTDARFVSVDIDRNPQTANAFGVEAVPTVVFLYPDGTSKQYVGTEDLLPYEKLEALLQAK